MPLVGIIPAQYFNCWYYFMENIDMFDELFIGVVKFWQSDHSFG